MVHQKPAGHAGLTLVYHSYTSTARKKGMAFNLTREQVHQLTSSLCYYCGVPPSRRRTHNGSVSDKARTHGEYRYNGIDRIDSHQGYIDGNVVPCCKDCNYGKSTMTTSEFLAWIERVHTHQLVAPHAAQATNKM